MELCPPPKGLLLMMVKRTNMGPTVVSFALVGQKQICWPLSRLKLYTLFTRSVGEDQ